MAQLAKKKKTGELDTLIAQWETRWRTSRLLLNLPRLLALALGVAVVLVLGVRLTGVLSMAVLLPIVGLLMTLALGAIMSAFLLRRRPLMQSAQHFDRQFGLQERLSTALELRDGRIRTMPELADRQLESAVLSAQDIDPRQFIQYETPWLHWLGALLVAIVLVLLLLLPDSGASALSNPVSQAAITDAAEEVRDITEEVANETSLTSEERESLLESLETALDDLQEPDTSTEEAFAAMSELEESLRSEANSLRNENDVQQTQFDSAAQSLSEMMNNSQANQGQDEDAGEDIQSLESASLEEAMAQAQQAIQEMSPSEQQAFAAAMQQAAEQLANDPALQEALRQAAESLQENDLSAAQEQLEQAMEQAQQAAEQQQNQEELAQNIEQMADRASQSAEQIAQSEQSQQQGEQQQNQSQQEQQQQNSQQEGGAPSSEQQQQQGGEQGEGEQGNQPSNSDQQGPSEGNQASNQPSEQAGQQSSEQASQPGQASQSGEAGSAGDSEGNPSSQQSGSGQEAEGGNNPDGEGESNYQPIYAPQRLDAEGSTDIQLETDPDEQPVVEGDFQDNPFGESTVPYNQVFQDYADAANRAIESDYVPLGLRGVIRQYFSSLEPEN